MIAMLKPFRLTLAIAASVGFTSFIAHAQQPPQPPQPQPSAPVSEASRSNAKDDFIQERDPHFTNERLGLIQKATRMIGMPVENRSLKSLGKVADIALDVSNGSVPLVLVSSGSEIVPVPARNFFGLQRDKFLLDIDEKVFADAPRVANGSGLTALDAATLDKVYRHFGRSPSEITGKPDEWTAASAILRTRLLSQANEPLGEIEDLMVDVPLGRLTYLIVAPSGGSNPADTRYAIPPQALRANAADHTLVLQATQEKFLAGPHFEKAYGAMLSDQSMAAKIYGHYGLPAYATPTSARPAQQVYAQPSDQRREASTVSTSDHATTQAILREVVQGSLANVHAADGIAVITLNGRVTLRGNVDNEKRKTELGAMAERVAGASNVDNQLVVASKK